MSWERSNVEMGMEGHLNVLEMYRDLGRKYRNVGKKVDTIWREFTPKQREEALRESVGDRVVLKHSRDPSLGTLVHYIPEYNLKDMTSDPEHFLSIFEFRATMELSRQLYTSADGGPGDREFIERSNIRFAKGRDEYRMCFHETMDGKAIKLKSGVDRSSPEFADSPFNGRKLIFVEYDIGEHILARQETLIRYLNYLVEEILDLDSDLKRSKKTVEKNVNPALVSAVSNLNVQSKPLKSSLPEVCAQAIESRAALEDYLLLLRTEPIVLNDAVNTAFWSRAELVPDDRGRVLPAMGDRYLSAALFDSVTTTVKSIAIWDYILRLLQQLENVSDKIQKGLILQELSNTCHLEYRRTQEIFKRSIATPMPTKHFKRITDGKSGISKITMKTQPADCTVSDPQMHYILQLCHTDTTPKAAVQWIQKLDDHNTRHEDERKKLSEADITALGDLSIIVSFMHMMSTAISMVPVSRKSGLMFTARSNELERELEILKPRADFGDYVIPVDNLLEPNMAAGALTALDDFVVEGAGARLSSLYEGIVQDSLQDLETMYADAKARLDKVDKTTYVPLPTEPKPSGDARVASRREKEKTRPASSSVYTITAPPETPQIIITEPKKEFKVNASTASVFTTLFDKSEARGSVAWVDFEAAMADLGFSVTPKGGSIFTFNPPALMDTRPITLHRPHVSEIEGYKLLIIARRLQRAYEWDAKSFVVA